MTDLYRAALHYSKQFGWATLPCSASKSPLCDRGVNAASKEPCDLLRWFHQGRPPALGIATGAASGVWVLDIDGALGEQSLRNLEAAHGSLPATLAATTPTNGRHLFFVVPEGRDLRCSTGKVAKGIDVRASGGYVVVAPSRCARKDDPTRLGEYKWIAPPDTTPLAAAPEWLLALVDGPPKPATVKPPTSATVGGGTSTPYAAAALAGECETVATAPEGERNATLNKAAYKIGGLVGAAELDRDIAHEALMRAAAAAGLGEVEARRTIESGLTAGASAPRGRPDDSLERAEVDRMVAPLIAESKTAEAFPFDAKSLREHGVMLGEAPRPAAEIVAGAEWPAIIPFDTLDAPDFPTHALPGVLRRWVEAESHSTQTPSDLAGLLALAVHAACVARRVVVEPRSGWREPANLFVAVLLEPGNRKSAVFADATHPLRELESRMIEEARADVAKAQSERRQREKKLNHLEVLASHGDGGARHAARELAAELAMEPVPTLPRLLADDVTAEKLGAMLDDQHGRIASVSAEGNVFDLMAGLYSKGTPNFDVYLKGHAGDPLVVDRLGRPGVRVLHPALSCVYALQPAVISGLAAKQAFRGRGLLARFLYAAPRSRIGHREVGAKPVPDGVREAYDQSVRKLFTAAEEHGKPRGDFAGVFGNNTNTPEPFVLRLDRDAGRVLHEWETEIESMLADGGAMEGIRDWGAKLAGATLRLAGATHCVEHGLTGAISAATLAGAIEIARYLIPHAAHVLGGVLAGRDVDSTGAWYLLRWIERHGRREFTKSEAQHHGKHRFARADDIDPALADLAKRGFVRPKSPAPAKPGRPPSPAFEVNPAVLLEARPHDKYSRYSQNSTGLEAAPIADASCGNIRNIPPGIGSSGRGDAPPPHVDGEWERVVL